MEYSPVQIPAADISAWASFELAKSFDRWLQARGIDCLDLGEGRRLDRLRSEWLGRDGGEVDRLRSEWLRTEKDREPSSG
jgi:hypothetical protein